MNQIAPFFAQLEDYIRNSRVGIAMGEDLDLTGLDQKIGALCDMVFELSKEEQAMYEKRLQDLLSGLNELGLELKTQMETIKELPKHKNASVAYKTADARDNFGKHSKKDE